MEEGKQEEMNPESMEEKKRMVISMCTCEACPSYNDCSLESGEKELGFCFPTIGKSKCIMKEKGCICGTCPVTEKMELKHIYFCTKGSKKEQSEM